MNIKKNNNFSRHILSGFIRPITLAGIIVAGLFVFVSNTANAAEKEKDQLPRLLVLTDIGDDPDDEQSLVRLLVYANKFDIEGFVTELWWKDTHNGRHGFISPEEQMELLHQTLDLYEKCEPILSVMRKVIQRQKICIMLLNGAK